MHMPDADSKAASAALPVETTRAGGKSRDLLPSHGVWHLVAGKLAGCNAIQLCLGSRADCLAIGGVSPASQVQ